MNTLPSTSSTSNWSLKSLGKHEIDVYDLGVQDNENFFANDILVHNSNYLNLQDLVHHKFGKDYKAKGITDLAIAEWLVEFFDGKDGGIGFLENFMSNSYQELATYMNCKKQQMTMALEKISSASLFKNKKKRYALAVIYNEGTWYKDTPKISITGLESVSSRTPKFARKFLNETYGHMLLGDPLELQSLLNKQRLEFNELPLDKIAETVSINKGIEDIEDIDINRQIELGYDEPFNKGVRSSIKAAFVHNKYNIKNNIYIRPINVNGVKVKMLKLRSPNNITTITDRIAYVGSFPEEWSDVRTQIDKTEMWQDKYMRTVENFTEDLDYIYNYDITLNVF